MTSWRERLAILVFAALAFEAAAPLAAAQSTNALPNLSTTTVAFDPAKVAGLPDGAKAAAVEALAKMKRGDIAGFVLATSKDMKVWALTIAPTTMTDYSPADGGRQALEACEFEAGKPCSVLSVNGYQARPPQSWASEPEMLFSRPSDFDPTVLPFVAAKGRVDAAAYDKASTPRAFALTTNGLWLWRGGANVVQAIERTMTDCLAQFKPAPCLLYAVNNRVVFEAR
jgi:hypothetical protein